MAFTNTLTTPAPVPGLTQAKTIQGGLPPGAKLNPDGTYNLNGVAYNPNGSPVQQMQAGNNLLGDQMATVDQGVAAGTQLPGADMYAPDLQAQNELNPNLTDAQALAKMQGDFGLGTNNNAPTTAAIAASDATGAKYAQSFGGQATSDALASAAANNRGLSAYQANTGPEQTALGNANQDRSMQTNAYGQLMQMAQAPQGPSAADAQLAQSTAANQANAIAMARSGRGMGGSASGLRQAIAQNAVTQQTSNAQMAAQKANEYTAYQAAKAGDLSSAGAVAGQTVSGDQGTAASGLAGAQYQTTTALQGTTLNDQSAQAWAAQQAAATSQAEGSETGAQTQDLNLNSTALAGRESQYASQNQTHGIDAGDSTQAGIADANRTQSYVGAGLSATGAVIASDEDLKTNVQPLSGTVAPIANQAPATTPATPSGPSANQKQAATQARDASTGGTVGQIGGAAAGTAIAGPVGGVIGSVAGKFIGSTIGKLVSDVRNKTGIVPLGTALSAAGATLQGRNPRPN